MLIEILDKNPFESSLDCYEEEINKFLTKSQSLLKSEWNQVKREAEQLYNGSQNLK